MKHTTYVTKGVQVDHFARVKIARLDYDPADDRADCKGALYIAPITRIHGLAPADWAGELCLYATTNADPVIIGYLRDGGVQFIPEEAGGVSDDMLRVLQRAQWEHPSSGEGYSFVVEDAIDGKDLAGLDYV